MMGPILLTLLVLVAGCCCAPGNLLVIDGFGFQNYVKDTGDPHLKLEDKIAPEVNAQEYTGISDKAADGSTDLEIGDSSHPDLHGVIEENKNNISLPEFPLDPSNHTFEITADKTNENAKELVRLPLASGSENQNGTTQQFKMNEAPSTYGPVYPYGSYPYGSSPYGSYPYGSYPYGSYSYGSYPYGSYSYGSYPYGSYPYGSYPYGSYPYGSYPYGSYPYGSYSYGSYPYGSLPCGSYPYGSYPYGSYSYGSYPYGSYSNRFYPNGSYPYTSYPYGSDPSG